MVRRGYFNPLLSFRLSDPVENITHENACNSRFRVHPHREDFSLSRFIQFSEFIQVYEVQS